MVLESLILAALAAYQLFAVVYLALLTFYDILGWFSNRSSMSSVNRDRLGFTLQDMLSNGDYRTVQGVFNRATGTVQDARKIDSGRVDGTLADYHSRDRLVVYP